MKPASNRFAEQKPVTKTGGLRSLAFRYESGFRYLIWARRGC